MELSARSGLADCDPAAGRIEPPHVPRGVGGEPDVARRIGGEAMASRVRDAGRVLPDRATLWIDPPEDARTLTRIPDGTIGCGERIVRERARCRYRPFMKSDRRSAGDHLGSSRRLRWKTSCQVVGEPGTLVI